MIFDPEMISKMAIDFDPEPFNQALDQAAAERIAQGPIISNFGGPVPGANPMTGAPGAGMNFSQIMGGAQGMMLQPASPLPAPMAPRQAPAPNLQPIMGQLPGRGQVPDLATILGRR